MLKVIDMDQKYILKNIVGASIWQSLMKMCFPLKDEEKNGHESKLLIHI
jgi:hypothetical protein